MGPDIKPLTEAVLGAKLDAILAKLGELLQVARDISAKLNTVGK